jgi:hypothetical protein
MKADVARATESTFNPESLSKVKLLVTGKVGLATIKKLCTGSG